MLEQVEQFNKFRKWHQFTAKSRYKDSIIYFQALLFMFEVKKSGWLPL